MDLPTNLDALQVLLALLPGFLTVQVLDVLVVREDRKPFERVIQALIFTFLVHVLWYFSKAALPAPPGGDLTGLAFSSLVLGLGVTFAINSGFIHKLLRWCRLTRAASRPSEWYDAFYEKKEHVVLHLKDGRRVFGWPKLYPLRPDKGHLLVENAEWLDRPDPSIGRRDLDFLIDVTDVRFVEFVPLKPKESSRG